jgi:UDP:flavonoid glycosyltransferase YjiC (YdhE family)
VQIARELVRRGDEVYFLCGREFQARIEEAGATFLRLPYDDRPPGRRRPGEGNGVREVAAVLETYFLEPMEVDFRTVLGLVRSLSIDLVLAEPLFIGASIVGLLPRDRRPAVLSVGLFPLIFNSPETAPYGFALAPIDEPLNRIRNLGLRLLADVTLLGRAGRRFLGEAERLTGTKPDGGLYGLALAADAYAQLTVPQFEYPRRRLSPKVHFLGPLPPPPFGPLPSWWDYSDHRRIVHVSQGTYANTDPTELIVPTLRGLAGEDVLVVATTGGPEPASVVEAYGGPLPDNARVERFLPYDHLLAAASVMVTNGGYAAVQHALRWGLPLVVSGTSEDRPEVNARVAWSGAGLNLKRRSPAPEAIRDAVSEVLTDPSYQRSAARLGAAIAGTDAIRDMLALVDSLIAGNAPASSRTAGPVA